jgi:hexosaminidase
VTLCWKPESTPSELQPILRAIAEEYPVEEMSNAERRTPNGEGRGPGRIEVRFEHAPDAVCTLKVAGRVATVSYGASNQAMRAVGTLLAGLVPDPGTNVEHTPFGTLGFMLDCSRNAVMKPEHLKRWLRRLCLFGYNLAMLYTEDTYELPGEDRFGYVRGPYTGAELRELDHYCRNLGIQLVGCIQTLGHMEQVLRWPAYAAVKDSESVLLVGDEQTYGLIGKMLDAMAGHMQSRRIHIGMDEAWGLGRGRYLDRFGFKRQGDVFIAHLDRVARLCRDRGLAPMMWSDMFFSLGSKAGNCFDPQSEIPSDLVASIPRDLQLVYWDYYHKEKDFYLHQIARHRQMGYEPVMASGIWTWKQLWYNRRETEANAGVCIDACRAAGLKEVFFTLWGDDGAYCDFDSALAGLAFAAERAFATDSAWLERRFRAVCGASYEAVVTAAGLTGPIRTAGIMWDDPLLGMFHHEGVVGTGHNWPELALGFDQLRDSLVPFRDEQAAGNLSHAVLLADFLYRKVALRLRIDDAYVRQDRAALGAVVAEIPGMVGRLDELAVSWRRQWLERNKPFGLETLQIRLAGQAARYRELEQRLNDYIAGNIDSIPELIQRPPDDAGRIGVDWRDLASGSTIV